MAHGQRRLVGRERPVPANAVRLRKEAMTERSKGDDLLAKLFSTRTLPCAPDPLPVEPLQFVEPADRDKSAEASGIRADVASVADESASKPPSSNTGRTTL